MSTGQIQLMDIFMNNRSLLKKTILFCLLFCLLLSGCKKKEDIVGIVFLGYPAFGNPDKAMRNIVQYIESCDKNVETYKTIGRFIPKNTGFIYFSFEPVNCSYQLAWWSGETTWVYDSREKKYYETKEDLMHKSWYKIGNHVFPSPIIKVRLYER